MNLKDARGVQGSFTCLPFSRPIHLPVTRRHCRDLECGDTTNAACAKSPLFAVMLPRENWSAGSNIKWGCALAMTIGCRNLGGICSSFTYHTAINLQLHQGYGTFIGCLIICNLSLALAAQKHSLIHLIEAVVKATREGSNWIQYNHSWKLPFTKFNATLA